MRLLLILCLLSAALPAVAQDVSGAEVQEDARDEAIDDQLSGTPEEWSEALFLPGRSRLLDGAGPLHLAAAAGDLAEVTRLLDEGADPEALTTPGGTPLLCAAEAGREDCVALLLSRGADPHARTRLQLDALLLAVINRRPVVVRTLLEAGFDPDGVGARGTTPLMAAAWLGDARVAQQLVIAGADPAARSADGLRALDFARFNNQDALIEMLGHLAR